jgi:hypothetical protein
MFVVENLVTKELKAAHATRLRLYKDKGLNVTAELASNGLDEEYADEDGSDIEAQVNWNIANEREPEFSRDIDAEDF